MDDTEKKRLQEKIRAVGGGNLAAGINPGIDPKLLDKLVEKLQWPSLAFIKNENGEQWAFDRASFEEDIEEALKLWPPGIAKLEAEWLRMRGLQKDIDLPERYKFKFSLLVYEAKSKMDQAKKEYEELKALSMLSIPERRIQGLEKSIAHYEKEYAELKELGVSKDAKAYLECITLPKLEEKLSLLRQELVKWRSE